MQNLQYADSLVLSLPLHLSTFTLDEFEHAIRHSVIDPTCPLIAEVHSALIYNLRTVPFQRHSAVRSILHARDRRTYQDENGTDDEDDEIYGINTEQLSAAMADVGNNWERVPLRASEGRQGWEDTLVGCLKDASTFH
jgi:bromodomain adjacent to zinc finger domain protein 1A